MGSKNGRRGAPSKKDIREGSTCGGVAGGNTITRDFWSRRGPTWAGRKQFSPEKREWIGSGTPQESTAGRDDVGEIDVAFVFGNAKGGIHGPGDSLCEIEQEEPGENFLKDEVGFLCMEMDQAHGVLQAAEGGFDAPAHGVELSQQE